MMPCGLLPQQAFPSCQPASEFPRPNNALQRTEAGGRLFSPIYVLRRQPPSLSLGPLGHRKPL